MSASYWQEPHTRETLARRRLVLEQAERQVTIEQQALADLEVALDLQESLPPPPAPRAA